MTRERKLEAEIRCALSMPTADVTVTIDTANETIHAVVNGYHYNASDAAEFNTLDFALANTGALAFTCNNCDQHLAPSTRR